jgi:hypothetical protein
MKKHYLNILSDTDNLTNFKIWLVWKWEFQRWSEPYFGLVAQSFYDRSYLQN